PTFMTKRAVLVEMAAEVGVTLDALALAAVLAQPWVDVVLSGAATVAQLHSNVAALQVSLPETMLERLKNISEPPEEYWATRSRLAWN
ncbi:MAG: aldo/keto reductase, partial [Anaerolineae bacterium]|nr:aldo/keto reductase [Anaerolineae bacterium]